MVKLASARDWRTYGPRRARSRAEYINAGIYLLATVVLIGGFVATGFSMETKSGLVLLLIALGLIMAVNLHDLFAHLAGIDYRLSLMEYDVQLALVEFGVPIVQAFGALLLFVGVLFLFIQEEKGSDYYRLENHALNLLIAGPVLWVLGSIHNSCQIYERADGHVQILQESVHLPFLLGSLLFLVGAIVNIRYQTGKDNRGLELLGSNLIWMAVFGSMFMFAGGLMNVVKVFKMQQVSGLRLEKLRGGAQELLEREREGQMPFIVVEEHRNKRLIPQEEPVPQPTPYKDVLLRQTS
ncbi:hypothetical protein K2173_013031 [Erythroxylum novogranatense]|uniref:Uncharacterized protein n=1 Tax=Erythroxylum novogranatense TaxID=1862640 RepID=A0AAV8S734_9ROSI|nr:hypothetical protein K2173_013031 [Erythroxylum novogranatense]